MVNARFKYKIKDVARKHNLPESVVEEIFNSQFKFFRETVSSLPLKTLKSEEEFNELRTIFYFKFLGKFFTTWGKNKKLMEISKNKKQKKENGED